MDQFGRCRDKFKEMNLYKKMQTKVFLSRNMYDFRVLNKSLTGFRFGCCDGRKDSDTHLTDTGIVSGKEK